MIRQGAREKAVPVKAAIDANSKSKRKDTNKQAKQREIAIRKLGPDDNEAQKVLHATALY